jgi:hypothetical protein
MQKDAVGLVNGHKDRDLGLFIGFAAAGVAGLGVGLWGVLRGPKATAPSQALMVLPVAGPGLGGAAVGGRF